MRERLNLDFFDNNDLTISEMCRLEKVNLHSGLIVLLAVMIAFRINKLITEEQMKNNPTY